MSITVRIITGESAAAVLSYPRQDGEPVEGAEFTEVARVPAFSQHDVTADASHDVLVIAMPADGPAEAAARAEAA
ncbi:hypothetical protein [Erythrobacter sp. WG]|uniref:hypothetical protein n=1 Tax=Erythrobacter sp. WG TaxID=2985510 RepID=UPI00226DEA8B|nr:hypothetical protein [Erythrobacter sp. WG]MCX9146615.1 hypothetical protein [Erythrobacter sp. WG]